METTRPKKLKNKLKEYLDLAKKEIVKIKRKSGEKFILLSEDKYNELKAEIGSLQKRILGKVKTDKKSSKAKVQLKKSTKKQSTTKKISTKKAN